MELFRRDVCVVLCVERHRLRDSNAEAGEKDFWLRYPYGSGRGLWPKPHGSYCWQISNKYPALFLSGVYFRDKRVWL